MSRKEKIIAAIAEVSTILIYGIFGYVMGRVLFLLVMFVNRFLFDNKFTDSLNDYGVCGFLLMATIAAITMIFNKKY